MLRWLAPLLLPLLAAPALAAPAPGRPDPFAGLDGCFLLLPLKATTPEVALGGARCRERVPACSTFKLPLALMAADAGLLRDEHTSFKWDGKRRALEPWNADQTAASWMKHSVVWVSQILAPRLGATRLKRYLADFRYGTQDLSGGLTTAWLTVENHPEQQTLRLSAEEQLLFLARLWRAELRVSAAARALAIRLLPVERSTAGAVLRGKTGSGLLGPRHDLRLGWFAAHLEHRGSQYVAVVSFTERRHREHAAPYAGMEAREMMKTLLAARALW